ncbi:transcriptional regulator [Desulfosporosinus orientis DSM 765]|uniref:Transcriptional regulator n=1 Tax=Desulfosporosinus orientis (strain ATCC 19365 / DSM 765 / NCIMB 8382 / VKM B-1628 / Singapore I) TaxID=768706 RepID=G7WDG5_DESOD|nr:MarR family transcriptional regulator [Desulfosporosinus orientis]AET67934.1 transcriptional regulator [Desulfosporosinus orientis DSM 765]
MDYDKELHLLHLMQQVYSSLISASNKLQTTGDKYCVPLTSRQYMTVLAMLHLPEEETTIVNIANKLGATKQNVTQLVGSLAKKGLVEIVPSKRDKRAVNVRLTDFGLETMVNCGSNMSIDFMADIFRGFDEKELETLWNLLGKLYRFDGTEMEGFEADVKVPNTFSDEEVRLAIERFSLKRRN